MSTCLKCGKERTKVEELLNCPYCYKCATNQTKSEEKNMKQNLEEYLRDNYKKGIVDHSIRVIDNGSNIQLYIHPAHADGETLDFIVNENQLYQLHNNEDIYNALYKEV